MQQIKKIAMTVVGPAILIAALTSCSDGESKTVPELPERICWGAFASKDVAPLLPTGTKATFSALSMRPLALPEEADLASCALDIDGDTEFQATARRRNFEDSIEWSSMDKAKPVPIDAGKKGIVRYGGAASYIVCQPSKTPFTPGKYIDLRLWVDSAEEDDTAARTALPKLMKQFVAFAERELKCD
ncbi:hypothetical protein ACFT7S_01545 [Streptomyces sp. NPDC057136]|uniref:hypothetical protein n=1 Tax=Streptomyces sp. NPDC057136 TaxID=3346029 RepID=UPI00362B64C2